SEQTVDQSRRKRITSADAIENLEVLANRCLVEFPVGVTHGAPVIDSRCLRVSECGSDDFEIWKLGDSALNHALKVAHVEFRMVLVLPFDFKSERGRKVFFIADHDVDQR